MQIISYGKNVLILNLMYPLKSRNVPLGVHIPPVWEPLVYMLLLRDWLDEEKLHP